MGEKYVKKCFIQHQAYKMAEHIIPLLPYIRSRKPGKNTISGEQISLKIVLR